MAKRQWWQKPQLRTDEDQNIHRKVSWLELFFDLIFVVVVAELSHYLAKHVSLEGVGSFILLFLPVWWVWIGATYYNERFETEGLENRIFTFLQIIGAAGLAVFVHDGLGKTSIGFALAYVLSRLIITYLWVRGGYHDRPISAYCEAIWQWLYDFDRLFCSFNLRTPSSEICALGYRITARHRYPTIRD
ncbi:MAG: low temperature requirement protein A [Microcoleus sp. SU_5_6]|nr:low temperature requirement protein A [Microcoleus sp. SU_5_6]